MRYVMVGSKSCNNLAIIGQLEEWKLEREMVKNDSSNYIKKIPRLRSCFLGDNMMRLLVITVR